MKLIISVLAILAIVSLPFIKYFSGGSGIVGEGRIREIISEYIHTQQEEIMKAIESYHMKKHAEEQAKILAGSKSLLYSSDYPRLGSGKKEIVTFWDYLCGYCARANSVVNSILDKYKDVSVVVHPMPIFGDESIEIARSAFVVNALQKEKYKDWNDWIFSELRSCLNKGEALSTCLANSLEFVGISRDSYDNFLRDNGEKIEAYINNTRMVGVSLGLRGTPAFIIGDDLVPGFIDENDMERLIEDLEG